MYTESLEVIYFVSYLRAVKCTKPTGNIFFYQSTELIVYNSRMVSVCNCKKWLLFCVIVLLYESILVDVAVAQCSGKFV